MRKYMICRVDAVERRIKSSEMFPGIIEVDNLDSRSHDKIVVDYLQQFFPGYVGKHDYYLVPMRDAVIVSFRPKREYTVHVTPVM